jgi:hypothetical protein
VSIRLKSMVIFFSGLFLFCLLHLSADEWPFDTSPSTQTNIGKYTIAASKDRFILLDTETGATWTYGRFDLHWQPMAFDQQGALLPQRRHSN